MTNLISMTIAILVQVESHGNAHAIGDHYKAVGILQIHKSIVQDCQRIYPEYQFTMRDRYDPYISVEMARVWLSREAARRHIESPLLLAYVWNAPRTGKPRLSYRKRVYAAFKKINHQNPLTQGEQF